MQRQSWGKNNPQIGCKTYWSILNKFMHKKKIPLIPPIFLNNIYITDISEIAHLFNVFLRINAR